MQEQQKVYWGKRLSKVLEEKAAISEVSEFSILPYTQNRKRGNLGKFSFTSIFDISCNLR